MQAAIPASGRLPCTECVRVCRLAAALCAPTYRPRDRFEPRLSFSFEMNRSEKYSNSPPGQSRNRSAAYLRPRIIPKFVDFSMLLSMFPLWGAPLGKEKTVEETRIRAFFATETKFDANSMGINRGWIRIEGLIIEVIIRGKGSVRRKLIKWIAQGTLVGGKREDRFVVGLVVDNDDFRLQELLGGQSLSH